MSVVINPYDVWPCPTSPQTVTVSILQVLSYWSSYGNFLWTDYLQGEIRS